jgi:hypothetical protein
MMLGGEGYWVIVVGLILMILTSADATATGN